MAQMGKRTTKAPRQRCRGMGTLPSSAVPATTAARGGLGVHTITRSGNYCVGDFGGREWGQFPTRQCFGQWCHLPDQHHVRHLDYDPRNESLPHDGHMVQRHRERQPPNELGWCQRTVAVRLGSASDGIHCLRQPESDQFLVSEFAGTVCEQRRMGPALDRYCLQAIRRKQCVYGMGLRRCGGFELLQPAFFLWPGGYPVATRQDFSYAVKNGTIPGTVTVPAKPGDILILWGTGFGPTSPLAPMGTVIPSGTIYSSANPVSVTIGGRTAMVYGAALTPGAAGLYQVAIQVPPSLPDGDYNLIATVYYSQTPPVLLTVQQ